jgi:hypothetical protein
MDLADGEIKAIAQACAVYSPVLRIKERDWIVRSEAPVDQSEFRRTLHEE